MPRSDSINELHPLVDALVDDRATEEMMTALNQRLESDAEFRRAYMSCMAIEAELSAIHVVPAGGESRVASSAPREPSGSGPVVTTTPRAARRGWRSLGWAMAVAASLLLVAGGSGWLVYWGTAGGGPLAGLARGLDRSPNPTDTPAGEVVASISGTRNCRWSRDSGEVGYGAQLEAGRELTLEAGLAEVTFASGARIVIEGPAVFEVPADDRARLVTGRMAAAVPRGAAGFSVRTPRLAISESGSQYGVIASIDGGTEVHVFEGPVHARAVDASGRELGSVELVASEAARLAPIATSFALFRADGASFVRTLTPSAGPTAGLLAIEEFDYPVGPLAWQNGGFGWAGPWTDIEAAEALTDEEGAATNGVADGSLPGCELVSRGNRAQQTAQQNRIRRALGTSIRGVFDSAGLVENQDGVRLIGQSDTTIYISFMQRVSRVNDVFYGFELHRGDGNYNRVLCIGNGADEAGYGVTSNFNAYNADNYLPLGNEDTQSHLLVIRIDFGKENRDLVTVYRDPESLLEERACTPIATLRGNFAFDRISLGNFNGTKVHEVDEIRLGTSFPAVTGQRSPAPRPLAAASVRRNVALVPNLTKSFAPDPVLSIVNLGGLRAAGESNRPARYAAFR